MKVCFYCGDKFKRNGRSKYCSAECSESYRKAERAGAKFKMCPGCEQRFKGSASRVYCSATCARRYKSKLKSDKLGTKNVRYQLLTDILGGCCIRCGSSNDLHVHHIIPFSHGGLNTKENVILLCSECHKLAHGKNETIAD